MAVTTGMVRLEVLAGARSPQDWARLVKYLAALPDLRVADEHWDSAANVAFRLRRQGISLPHTDLLIATVAILEEATIVHQDKHFDVLAVRTPLKVESYVPA